jgi:hypothetical protein
MDIDMRNVRVTAIPPDLPRDDLQTRNLFAFCVGHSFEVQSERDGLLELHVGAVLGVAPYLHSIWIEPYHTDDAQMNLKLSGKMAHFLLEAVEFRVAAYRTDIDNPQTSENDCADMSNDSALLMCIVAEIKRGIAEKWPEA